MSDLISRQDAIKALWKALYDYEDKTEKQFLQSNELSILDWMQHRIFVQDMNDIDRQTILELPSAEPERTAKVLTHEVTLNVDNRPIHATEFLCGACKKKVLGGDDYCSHCGARLDWSGNNE